MNTETTEATEPALTCPRCNDRPAPPGKPICAPCQDDENAEAAEAAAAEEDARTAGAARAADAKEQAAKQAQTPPATKPAPASKPAPAAAPKPAPTKGKPAPAPAAAKVPPPSNGAQRPAPTTTRPATMPAPSAAQAPPRRRMTMDAVKVDAADAAPRLWIYGVEGLGKSTLAADAEATIFVPGGKSPNIQRPMFPVPESFQDVLDAIDELTASEHKYRTLVFDDFDYVEGLVWDRAVREYNKTQPKVPAAGIEDIGGGYGKGYQASADIFKQMIPRLERLRAKTNMQVIFVSHCVVKSFKNPTANDYDRYVNSMNEKAVAMFRRWCDAMLFVNYVDKIRHDWKARKTFAEGSGERCIYTQRRPSHDAKNRYDLPFQMAMPIDAPFAPLAEAIQVSRDPRVLRGRIEEKLIDLGDENITSWVRAQLEQPNLPTDKLSRINTRLIERIEERDAATSGEEQAEAAS